MAKRNSYYESPFLPFNEAREFVHKLNLKSIEEWRAYSKGNNLKLGKKPTNIPSSPAVTYKNKGWINWADWLGAETLGNYRGPFLTYNEAREFVRSLNLNSIRSWRKYCKGKTKNKKSRPQKIPTNPNIAYKNKGWINWADWLGTNSVAPKNYNFRSYDEAKQFIKTLNLRTATDWKRYLKAKTKLPKDIPTNPARAYKNKGWVNWYDWLGKKKTEFRFPFLSYIEAREFVHKLKLKSYNDWVKYCKAEIKNKGSRPKNIPSSPHVTYKNKGWINWADWLGKNKT